ncbi:MAG: hypothetical protein JRM77_02680 [Nitrososphaerota archaeon]|jgi:hypothetical protein|nr:hypothetical protein [Nitrososphaerota archaeon]
MRHFVQYLRQCPLKCIGNECQEWGAALADGSGVLTDGLRDLMEQASSVDRPEPKFNVICPTPGCKFAKLGTTAPIVIKIVTKWKRTKRERHYIYVVVNHYNGQKNKKNSYVSHSIGKINKTGVVLKHKGHDDAEIQRKIALKADAIRLRKGKRTRTNRGPR